MGEDIKLCLNLFQSEDILTQRIEQIEKELKEKKDSIEQYKKLIEKKKMELKGIEKSIKDKEENIKKTKKNKIISRKKNTRNRNTK